MQHILVPVAAGLGDGVLLFLVAGGLTLIFGVMGILNFAHGGYFMLGAFLGYTIAGARPLPAPVELGEVAAAALVVGAVGIVTERVVFRQLYKLSPMNSLLGTYSLLLIMEGAAQQIWGLNPLAQQQAPQLAGGFDVVGTRIPTYNLVLVAVGLLSVLFLQWLLWGTSFGRQARAVAEDRSMAALLGVNAVRVSMVVLFVGTFLAGLGGALAAPMFGVTPDLAATFIIQAFAVVVVGGLGSVWGSLWAALLLGLIDAFAVSFAPGLSQVALYVTMFLVLVLRPQGLLGRPDAV